MYEVTFPTRGPEDLIDSMFADLRSALGYAAWGMDDYPHLLTGYRDVAVIRDIMRNSHPVVAAIRVDDEFFLAKDTEDKKYALELLAIDHEMVPIVGDGYNAYTVYRRWAALDS